MGRVNENEEQSENFHILGKQLWEAIFKDS
jgi:hypothetical protein